MQKGSKIYSLEALTADPLATRNTQLFAALTALGIPPEVELCGEFRWEDQQSGRPRSATVWRLASQSFCGKYQTEEMIKAWLDPEFAKTNPEHPLAYIKCAFENHERSVDFIKEQGPIVMRRRGKKIAFISRHTSDERRNQIINELNRES